MKCPFCENEDTKVIDSRPTEDGHAIRRRRGCEKCGRRFTTYEKVEESIIMIVKKDGRREAFDRGKVANGIIKACEKRPVSMAEIESITNNIERGLSNLMKKEVKSEFIGELVMDELKELDEVAYVRFASVYRQFTDVNTFIKEIEKLMGNRDSRDGASGDAAAGNPERAQENQNEQQ
ncbi:transcriptional regulator NrdR [Hornefia porci]|uniref:transcriptional regulator NrdR n=1 Tax=Hornefia porci TaxID=2652292 RepID=UPI0009F8C749|nr:transcriptional regulator NrdR [Hornefia porci]